MNKNSVIYSTLRIRKKNGFFYTFHFLNVEIIFRFNKNVYNIYYEIFNSTFLIGFFEVVKILFMLILNLSFKNIKITV